MNDSRMLIKATEAVEIAVEEGTLTLLQRRIYNALYFLAGAELLKRETHTVPLAVLAQELNYSSRNWSHLVKALLGLTTVQVRWNYFAPSGSRNGLGASAMLAQAEVVGSIAFFSFPPKLRAILHAAARPAFIEFSVQRQLTSNYNQAIYELLAASRGAEQGVHYTPTYLLADLRRVLGVPDSPLYQEFRRLNARIIKPALQEISEVSPYQVEALALKKNHLVAALRFCSTPKPGTMQQGKRFMERLIALGCNQKQAAKILAQYLHQPDYLDGNLAYVEEQWRTGKVKRETPVPLLIDALKTDYRPGKVALPGPSLAARASEASAKAAAADDQDDTVIQYHAAHVQFLERQVADMREADRERLEDGFLLYVQQIQALARVYKAHGRDSRLITAAFIDYLQDASCPIRFKPWPAFKDWLAENSE